MKKKYVVNLSKEEKEQLEEPTGKGHSAARKLRRAHILLLADEGLKDVEIAKALNAAVTTVERVRKRFVEEGSEAALSERPRIGGALRRKLDGKGEAYPWWLWPAARRPRDGSAGRCNFWPTG